MASDLSPVRRRRRLLLRALAGGSLMLPVFLVRTQGASYAGPELEDPVQLAPTAETVRPEAEKVEIENGDAQAVAIGPEDDALPPPAAPAVVVEAPITPPPTPTAEPARAAPLVARARERATLPILMYHHVNDLPRTNRDPYLRDLTVPTLDFRQQLELLARHGVRSVSLDDLMSHLRGQEPLPERAAVLSFDDGYEDNYRLAYPLLRQYGLTATFFVVGNLVGQPGYMTWEQLREMQRHGMSIESHSLDHVDLAIQPLAELRRQLIESRQMLQLNLLRVVRFIAYPSGKYSPLVIAEARAAGYDAAVTVNYSLVQRATVPFELNRVRVKGADTTESLAAKLVPPHWEYVHGRFGA